MDSADDDFGELYVDEKLQATAPFACDVGFVKSSEESEFTTISDKVKGFEVSLKPESEGEMKKLSVVSKDSSSCVDVCAVNLTDAIEESEYSDSDDDLKIVLKDDDSKLLPIACDTNSNSHGYVEASRSCSFQKRRIGNWCAMPNGGIVNGRMMGALNPSPGIRQYGYGFSHPWFRTTCDANFDVFEKKPWRNPGTDTNDFFNFGFTEQSWKDYCKPLGRAIEVRDGTHERISSVDLRRPRDSDPDVVIQIPVTNDVEELSSMKPVEARSLGLSRTSTTASRSEDFHSDNGKGLNSSGNSMKEEASEWCEDENTGNFRGEQSPPKENCCSREVTPCDNEFIEEEKEETCWNSDKADSSSVERESSLGDRFHFSPTSSYSVGKTEESEDSETELSKDGATDDQREVSSTPPRRTRFAEHDVSSIKNGEMSGTKHSRDRRSHEDPSKRHCGRVDYGVHWRRKHRTVKDASATADQDLGKKVYSEHRNWYRDSSKSWQRGPSFPYSNRENRHGPSYLSADHDRDREHRFGWRNNEEASQGRSFNHSSGYKYEVRLKEHNLRSSSNLNQRNSRLSFKEEEDRYGRQHCERSPGLAYESNKERNQCDWLREPYYQDRIPITDVDYRNRLDYSYEHGSHNRKNDLYCRRNVDYSFNFHGHRYEDGVHRAESGLPFGEVGRREFQGYGINDEFSEIDERHHYAPDWHLDRFYSEQDAWYTKGSRGDYWRDDPRDLSRTEAYDSQNNQLYKDGRRDGWTQNVSIKDRLTYEDDWIRQDRGKYRLADDIHCSMREVNHSEHPSYTDEILVHNTRILTHNREIDHKSKKLRRGGHAFIKHQDDKFCNNQSRRRFPKSGDTTKPRNAMSRRNEKEEGEIMEEARRNLKEGIEIGEERIQESLKKMEKRRERFKETKFSRTVVATFQSQTEPDVANQERPVRKRRWCAS